MDLRCGEGRSQAVMAAYHALCNVRLMVEKDLRLNLTNHETGIADTEKPHGRGDRQEGSPRRVLSGRGRLHRTCAYLTA
jgi:hypothetical protein